LLLLEITLIMYHYGYDDVTENTNHVTNWKRSCGQKCDYVAYLLKRIRPKISECTHAYVVNTRSLAHAHAVHEREQYVAHSTCGVLSPI
jgi:hypothetical protein